MPYILSKTFVFACNKISQNSDYIIEVIKPDFKLSLIPTVNVKIQKLHITNNRQNFNTNIDNFAVCMRLLPLLSGKIHINNLSIQKIDLSATINNRLHFNKDFLSDLDSNKISCDNLKINDFKINIFHKNSNIPICYKGNKLEFSETYKQFKIILDSKISVADKISDIKLNLLLPKNNNIKNTIFDINISDINISEYGNYFKDVLPENLISLNGVIDIKANDKKLVAILKECSVNMKDSAKSIIFPQILTIKSDFAINKHLITIKSAEISSDTIHVSLSGLINNYIGKDLPTMELNIKINPSRLEDIVKISPPIIEEELNVYKLKKYTFYADTIGDIRIKGTFPEPNVTGNLLISNGILVKPLKGTPKGATIKLNFIGRHVNYDAVVPAKKTEKVMVKGIAELYNTKYAKTKVSSTQNVDLALTEQVLNPLHEILNFELGPLPIMDVHGLGNIDIDIKGTRQKPHIWGAFNFRNSNIKFNDIPNIVLENASGIMPFNDTEIEFITKTGQINGKDFSLKGKCNVYGEFDFSANTKGQPISKIYYAAKTSTIYPEINKMLPDLNISGGFLDMKLKIFGNMKHIEDMQFGENIFVKALITLRNGDFLIEGVRINKTNGNIKIDEKNDLDTDISALIDKYPASVKIKTKKEAADIYLSIPKINPNFLIKDTSLKKAQIIPDISIQAKYKGNLKNFESKKLYADIKVLEALPTSNIKINTGNLLIKDGDITINNLCGYVKAPQNQIKTNLKIKKAFDKKPYTDGNIYIKIPDLRLVNEIYAYEFLPKNIKNILKDFEFNKGKLNTELKIVKNKLYSAIDLSGTEINYLPLELPITIVNGNLILKNNFIYLQKINILAEKMPILVDGNISDIWNKQIFNIYINSKPQQEFIDKYFNRKQIYPVKIKGDIVSVTYIKGDRNNFDINSIIKLNKEASIYYYGATIGDIENAISILLNTQIQNANIIKVKEFSYDKLIDSQRGKQTVHNMLKAWGVVQLRQNNKFFKDFHIKTSNPTDARIFNIIFRKPDIKQGQFTSDIKINGSLQNPQIIGDFNIFETEIPFFDTVMKNINFIFKDKIIEISSKGDVIGNGVIFNMTVKNNLTPPYHIENANIYLKDLNLNNITEKIKTLQVENVSNKNNSIENIGVNSIIYDKISIKADNIELRNIKATNVEAVTKMKKYGYLEIPNFKFDIANGSINGHYYQNKTNGKVQLSMTAENIDANDITKAIFDIDNQIYGNLTGSINLACLGEDYKSCMKTLEGETTFNVKDGRMPKLGSLEYLLKAGNLVKGGITGISIGSIIDIITPLKTGSFSNIYGFINMKDGIANQIEITTQGKDLSLFIAGNYNLSTSHANMEVFGLLSRKMSTMFGTIGNLSINTLFNVIPGVDLSQNSTILSKINRIPGIELSSKAYRKFIAEINGNINGENYVSSFKWINY